MRLAQRAFFHFLVSASGVVALQGVVDAMEVQEASCGDDHSGQSVNLRTDGCFSPNRGGGGARRSAFDTS